MSEPVFFMPAEKISLAEIVASTGAVAAAGMDLSAIIRSAAPPGEAGPGDLTFLDSPENAGLLETSGASACFVTRDLAPRVPEAILALVIDEPYRGYVQALQRMFPQAVRPKSLLGTAGINPGASIHSEARLEQGVIVDPGAVIGPRAEIGSGSIIGANSVIGAGVQIGRDCLIGPQVTVSHALIGDKVVVHPGARIGQSGLDFRHAFLALTAKDLSGEVPRIGRVIIQDGVEIGANATIDRGALGDTVIGEATRIGNLAWIAENAAIGRHCLIPAQSGCIAGTRLEDFARH